MMRFLRSAGVYEVLACFMSAKTPAICGAAIEVPEMRTWPESKQSGDVENALAHRVAQIMTPGAVISGFL